MEIYISINNREKVLKLPYLPPEFTVTSPQNNETYQALAGELNIVGTMGLKALAFESFFDDWGMVAELEEFRKRKVPVRLIITETPINIAATIDAFDTTQRKGKRVYYSITFKEFRFLGV